MDRHIQTIFCDDIRHELGGKLSYIGVYSGRLFLPTFPLTLPKLCLSINVLTPATRPFTKLSLRVMKDKDVLFEGNLDDSQLSGAVEVLSDSEMDIKDRVLSLQSVIVFSPFALEAPCTLRVLAETEDGELRGYGLKIEQTSTDMMNLQ
ncbi:DUF6941 family protein [Methylomonas methanica]|uniref:Uncharacterized protein n=1 Tax=Methylomonas methanica TaxID=421 RepID=A0A177MMB9_METMH|nr:hypothetical protein [Methylomonas methanica]OAI06751.1 hypothetical protein A1332_10875 [Methylomonas methanica]